MTTFPVTHSNLSPKHLGAYLQDKYDLTGNVGCKIIRSGLNDSYLVNNANTKYIFRVYSLSWRTATEIKEEIRLLQLLKENNVSVSYPINDREDNYIQTLNAPEGERFGVMFSFAEGEKMQNYSEELHYKAGALIAKMHTITENRSIERATYDTQILLIDSFSYLSAFLSSDTDEWKYMKSMQKLLVDKFASIDNGKMRKGIVHLDFWFDNFNIDSNEEITVFDFDFCGNGWLSLDLAYYMMHLFNIERDESVCQRKLDQFFAGYESICNISDEERKNLPILGITLYFFYLGSQCQRFENWSNSFLSETYLKLYVMKIIKRYADIHSVNVPMIE